jgi:hypothetical protein
MSGEKRLLIIEASDQSSNAPWGCYGTGIVGARNTAIGKGSLNTAAIVAECSESGTAAKISMDLSSNGYDDWWLPGKDELYKVYLNRPAISAGAITIGGEELSNTTYISSSELDGGSGFGLDFSTGMFNNGNAKPTANKFRAMRANFETKLEVGDYYQGGIVGYILQSGDPGYSSANTKGLIVAPNDQSTGAAYGCTGSFFNITGTQLLQGDENTQTIVNLCADSGTAAKICNDLDLNGYTDWWLPSLDELQVLYDNRTLINDAALQLANISGAAFNSSSYRSSSEFNASYAYTLSFLSGFTNNANSKSTLYRVRAIRYF